MHNNSILGFQIRVAAMVFFRTSLQLSTLWLFVWGTALLCWRISYHSQPWFFVWGAAALPAIFALAGFFAWKKTPTAETVRSLIDWRSACGGLLMADAERPLGSWRERLPDPSAIRLRWRGGKTVAAFLASAAFLLAVYFFPQQYVIWNDTGLEIGNDVNKLASAIEILREEKIIETQKAEFLKEKLKQIQDDSQARNPKKTFDSLDQLRSSMSRAARAAAQEATKKSNKLSLAEKLAEAMDKELTQLDEKTKKAAFEELTKLVEKAAAENQLAEKGLEESVLEGLHDGDLSPEDLRKLAQALKGARGDLGKMVGRLAKIRLIDIDELQECDGQCEGMCDGEECDVARIIASCRGGRGGVTEGPGHNEITWTDGTKVDGATFKEQALPPGSVASLKDSQKIAVGKVLPKIEEAVASQGGAIRDAAVGGGGANTQVVLPQHRAAVQRFFSRKD